MKQKRENVVGASRTMADWAQHNLSKVPNLSTNSMQSQPNPAGEQGVRAAQYLYDI